MVGLDELEDLFQLDNSVILQDSKVMEAWKIGTWAARQ